MLLAWPLFSPGSEVRVPAWYLDIMRFFYDSYQFLKVSHRIILHMAACSGITIRPGFCEKKISQLVQRFTRKNWGHSKLDAHRPHSDIFSLLLCLTERNWVRLVATCMTHKACSFSCICLYSERASGLLHFAILSLLWINSIFLIVNKTKEKVHFPLDATKIFNPQQMLKILGSPIGKTYIRSISES